MENKKASNARYVGPMTHAVAQELRALLARKKYSATRLAAEAKLAKSTLHKTLNAQRAIDVEDVFAICEFFSEDPGELLDAAATYARQNMSGAPSDELIEAIAESMGEEVVRKDGAIVHYPDFTGELLDDPRAVGSEQSEDGGEDGEYDG